MDHISIIIINYNSDLDTKECLASLRRVSATRDFKFNIIVLDNGSKEPFTYRAQLDNLEILRSEANLGFTGGNNLVLKHAISKYNSDYFLLLNSDTTVEADFLKNLYKAAKEEQKAGLFNPKIYFYPKLEFHQDSYKAIERGKVIWFAGGSIDWPNLASFHRGVDEVDRGQFIDRQKMDFATGCALFIKRQVLENIRLLNEKLFLYAEDVDLSLRARRAGYDLLLVPDSIIWDKNAGSSGSPASDTQSYYLTRNKLYVFAKYGDWRVRLTVLHLIWQILTHGKNIEKEALADFLLAKMGKRAII